jgi:hypothetical protein
VLADQGEVIERLLGQIHIEEGSAFRSGFPEEGDILRREEHDIHEPREFAQAVNRFAVDQIFRPRGKAESRSRGEARAFSTMFRFDDGVSLSP